MDDGREEQVLERILDAATLEVFRARVRPELLGPVVQEFEAGAIAHTGEDVPAARYEETLESVSALRTVLSDLDVGETPAGVASAVEFVLEGLHLSKRLNKDAVGNRATYRSRG